MYIIENQLVEFNDDSVLWSSVFKFQNARDLFTVHLPHRTIESIRLHWLYVSRSEVIKQKLVGIINNRKNINPIDWKSNSEEIALPIPQNDSTQINSRKPSAANTSNIINAFRYTNIQYAHKAASTPLLSAPISNSSIDVQEGKLKPLRGC